mmetsp:Transcript_13784/g.31246  ORF Transcript_13784/g.31246 Transcript_13784/m.31246 type:complete len:351 (-) Transcript_13784:164-1216(-)|eukprot:CAMPEP_0197913704 /NCGR_PEP_ID=MMETSP1439-20131203/77096_1 /TAXON_ID=66791 /ORGANISM="Gonyaulax spinifera, Strain CCMP409" /LENGTH=350 /DNA_ID=CAMNT_0043535573 /DNA_START=83 /DNA_END=1135 /DNA_ORIENTATION=-
MAPKASGKEIPCEGLPPGWKCLEKVYLSGGSAGKTYIRFSCDKHKNVLSLKAALKLHAEDNGQDPEEAMREYERKKEEKKEDLAKLREERGQIKGEKRNEAIDHFRAVHGKLDGATVVQFPGWRGESKVLENCGQISASYFDSEGRIFKLVNDIEAFLGKRMIDGEEIPDIAKARASIIYDEHGKAVNLARKGENCVDVDTQRKKQRLDQREVGLDYYAESKQLAVVNAEGAKEKAAAQAPAVRKILLQRGFAESTSLVAVTGGQSGVMETVAGLYYQLPENFNDRPCYQQVKPAGSSLACQGQYIFWSTRRDSWKIGSLDDGKVGMAFCPDDKALPTEISEPWSVLKDS